MIVSKLSALCLKSLIWKKKKKKIDFTSIFKIYSASVTWYGWVNSALKYPKIKFFHFQGFEQVSGDRHIYLTNTNICALASVSFSAQISHHLILPINKPLSETIWYVLNMYRCILTMYTSMGNLTTLKSTWQGCSVLTLGGLNLTEVKWNGSEVMASHWACLRGHDPLVSMVRSEVNVSV